MASFQAKTRWDRQRMREKKIVPASSKPIQKIEFWKYSKKIQKLQYGLFKSQDGTGPAENERKKKIIVLIHSNLTRNTEFQKNSKKIEKIKKHQYGFFSSQNGTGEAENVRKKNSRFDPFQPNPE